jgi:hypothetical protein
MASKAKPVEPTILELAQRVLDDPDGREWHRKARKKWRDAVDLSRTVGGEPLEHYDPEPLPDFRAGLAHSASQFWAKMAPDLTH